MRNRQTTIITILSVLLVAALAALFVSLTSDWRLPGGWAVFEGSTTIYESDAPGESNLGYLLAGTLLTWAGFFAYAVYLWRKNRDLRREVDDLRRTLGERDG